MSSIALIMAGDFSPLEDGGPTRQMLPISGEPLLQRTWKQLQPFGIPILIVADHRSICNVFDNCIAPDPQSNTGAMMLLDTQSVWGDRTFVLMGDTVYSDDVINMIMSNENDLSFYGDHSEIYGVVFEKNQINRVVDALENVGAGYSWWLWVFYRMLCGFDATSHRFDDLIYHFIPEGDYTRDFDSIDYYHKFLREHEWAR